MSGQADEVLDLAVTNLWRRALGAAWHLNNSTVKRM
jgi:hypothetical protein